jgi:hypothetical protein
MHSQLGTEVVMLPREERRKENVRLYKNIVRGWIGRGGPANESGW